MDEWSDEVVRELREEDAGLGGGARRMVVVELEEDCEDFGTGEVDGGVFDDGRWGSLGGLNALPCLATRAAVEGLMIELAEISSNDSLVEVLLEAPVSLGSILEPGPVAGVMDSPSEDNETE